MFRDRALGWKLAGALALAALFGVSSAVRARDVNPPLHRLLATPERWDGRELWFPAVMVRAGGTVEVDGLRLTVRGLEAAAGEVVGLRGTFRARERRLDVLRQRRVDPAPWRRWLMEAVSAAVAAWAFCNLFRNFRGPR